MRRVDLSQPELTYDDTDPEGFRAGMFRIGPLLGARQMGATVYELAPGQAICPYHYEMGEEEWLVVLQGRAAVRHPGGVEELGPMEATCFTPGREGAHQVRNDTGAPVRVLLWSTIVYPTVTRYPDSDKVGVYTGDADEDLIVRRSSAVGYYDGETG
jgi:uncharacterized cupin superfamily protein